MIELYGSCMCPNLKAIRIDLNPEWMLSRVATVALLGGPSLAEVEIETHYDHTELAEVIAALARRAPRINQFTLGRPYFPYCEVDFDSKSSLVRFQS